MGYESWVKLCLRCKPKQLRLRAVRYYINVLAQLFKCIPRGVMYAAGAYDKKRASEICAGLQSGEVVLFDKT